MIVYLLLLLLPHSTYANQTVRVGLYQNPPLIFSGDQSNPQGFYVDILRHIAARENWRLEYVSGTWQQCLDRLAIGEIDLQPAMPITQSRLETYDFNRQTIIANWAQVFAQPYSQIESFLALAINAEEAMVNANLMQLQQVITNLAVNARDAMPDGGTLSIGLDRLQVDTENAPLPELKPGAYLCWTMRDTGMGMPPDVVKRIFEPFFTTKAPGKGTGLGLAQVFGIVAQHEGKIDVESHEGKGTCFSIYFPETVQTQSEQKHPDTALVQGSKETVLLVEDDMGVRMIVRKFLENMNYQILEAGNGQEALDILKNRKDIDLILTDVVMPEMSGLKLVKHLRDIGRDMPVIMMSGYPLGEDREDIKKLRISGWLNKPLNMNALAQALQKALCISTENV